MRIVGVDDAGRGSILGPLIIAGVLLQKKNLSKLVALGVKDSKILSPRIRERVAKEIEGVALEHCIIPISPAEIDRVVFSKRKLHKLNRLEAKTMGDVITVLKPDVAFIDASDVLAERFKNHVAENIPFKVQIVSEHKADMKYPIVSAASIMAKVKRDQEILMLKERYGNIGSGYPSDHKTINFLENWIKNVGSYPEFVRKSWKPAKRIKEKVNQINYVKKASYPI